VQKRSEALALSISQTAADNADDRQMPVGFRHFLGMPKPSQRFKAYGVDPLDAAEHSEKIRGLMSRLSRRMDAQITWPAHRNPAHRNAEIQHWENPNLPSGYTYLLQFIAHDLVQTAMPLSVTGKLGAENANARRMPLRLETLFGSGPVGCPVLFAQDTPNDERRTKLRLGRMRQQNRDVEAGCPFRDIARTPAENVTGIDRSIPGMRAARTEALIADPRNDDHAIISQLTALLSLTHNGLVDMAGRGEPKAASHAHLGASYKRYLCARDGLTAIYHNIIRKDLMRRLLHPAIYAAYSGATPNFIERPEEAGTDSAHSEWRIPFEFTLGAFRFGHAMVRHEYDINDLSTHDLVNTLEKTSANDPLNMPLDSTWIVRWSRFFEIAGSRPNYSRRIGPFLSDGLGHDRIFPAVDHTKRVGLLYRDLLGSSLAGMWSVDALIAEIGRRRPQLIGASRLLNDRGFRVSQIREWLASEAAYSPLTINDIETLANDPPLPLFIWFEAMRQEGTEGLHLGPLGSIIVAEVIFGALERATIPAASRTDSLRDALAAISARYYPTNVFAEIPEIAGMDQLVEFTADIGDLRQAVPAFL
jgi:hypothetical protein